MTPDEFIARWKNNSLTEKGGAQPHFEDLCQLLGVSPPREYGEYCYEQDLQKMHGGIGFADVWKRGCFAWENKGPDKDLGPALMQLKNYSGALDNPPVLVVCNRDRIEVHPCFTGYPSTPTIILLEDICRLENLQTLRWLFSKEDIIRLRPMKSNAAITQQAAGEFAKIAQSMRQRGLDSQQVAHFLIQCIFCMYAEDETILHQGRTDNPSIFTAILKSAVGDPKRANNRINRLFQAMKGGGVYGNDDIAWFNGGLFNIIDVPELIPEEIAILLNAAEQMDWRAIDPTIFGTLFERGLDPSARAPLGAHYTDVETIQKLIRPLILEPLQAEWEAIKPLIQKAQGKGVKSAPYKKAVAAYQDYLERLRNFRVLDPACGSGNFLYLSMHALKDLEHAAQTDAEIMGLGRQISIETGPANILGIEINEYAAELARVTVWIGDIQWSQKNGRPIATNPILRSLDGISHHDALIGDDGADYPWPKSDVIIGNPPFVGNKKMLGELGESYTVALRELFNERLSSGVDLVTYWFERARQQIQDKLCIRAGLVSTQSIRKGANREVLDRILSQTTIFNAWSDEKWINDGAAVRVSLLAFGEADNFYLNGDEVQGINSDLTPAGNATNITLAKPISSNKKIAFQGPVKVGKFDIPGDLARSWLKSPNPNGKPNSDVLRPWANGNDLTKRSSDTWIIDFASISMEEAALYEAPFTYVFETIKPDREKNGDPGRRKRWWLHGRTGDDLRKSSEKLSRFIATVRVAKHRFFVWLPVRFWPDSRLFVICLQDDTSFGIVHSRFHELWSLANASRHGVGNDPTYNAKDCFETFPFPEGLSPADTSAEPISDDGLILPKVASPRAEISKEIAKAAFTLNRLRENWLNPAEWVDQVPEVVPGYPERLIPKEGHEKDLKKRTLTQLYNLRPAWLDNAHKALDKAVAKAYGWTDYSPEMLDQEILKRLLQMNMERS